MKIDVEKRKKELLSFQTKYEISRDIFVVEVFMIENTTRWVLWALRKSDKQVGLVIDWPNGRYEYPSKSRCIDISKGDKRFKKIYKTVDRWNCRNNKNGRFNFSLLKPYGSGLINYLHGVVRKRDSKKTS